MSTWPFTSNARILEQEKIGLGQVSTKNSITVAVAFDFLISLSIMYAFLFASAFPWTNGHHGIAAIFAPALVSLTYVLLRLSYGSLRECIPLRQVLPTIFLSWSCGLIFVVVAYFALGHGADISAGWLAASYVTGLVLLPLGSKGVALTSKGALGTGGAFTRNAYLISADRDAEVSAIIRDVMDDGVRVVGISYFDNGDRRTSLAAFCDNLVEEIHKIRIQNSIDNIYIRFPTDQKHALDAIIASLATFSVRVLLIGELSGDDNGRRLIQLGNRVATELLSPPISARGLVAKRVLDVAVASVALFALLPILAFACVGIAIESGRPIIFRQCRKGVCSRTFTIFKFRTMSVQENGDDVVQACRNDPRVTKLGAIFRRTSIDELPQLLNVIRGDMSIVGPRPHALAHDTYYGALIKDYSRRHNVKPGLTGWAQVNGFRGETRDLHAMSERIRHDIWYIENWTIWLDIRIIAKTAGCVLFQKQAY